SPQGARYAEATAINNSGVVVGYGTVGTTSVAFSYVNGTDTVPSQFLHATSINSSGEVVGNYLNSLGQQIPAIRFSPTGARNDLRGSPRTPAAGRPKPAGGINDSGDVALTGYNP